MAATLLLLPELFLSSLCARPVLCSIVSLDCASCLFFCFFCWRCWLLQHLVFLLHLSRDHKCMLAAGSPGVTCICCVTHNAPVPSQLIACLCLYLHTVKMCGFSVDVIVLSCVIFLMFVLACLPIPVCVCVCVCSCETLEWESVFVVYGL